MTEYAEAQVFQGDLVSIAAIPRASDGEHVMVMDSIELLAGAPAFLGSFRFCPDLCHRIAASEPDLIHSHGLWTYASLAAGTLAQRLGIPHVLAPCGMLQDGALRRSAWKKRMCRLLFQDRILERAACVHAKSLAEANGIRRLGHRGRIEVIPNPVSLPRDLLSGRPANDSLRPRTVLFLGRLHPVKGISRLVDAWISLKPHPDAWRLVVAGPDEAGMVSGLKRRLAAEGVADSVVFPGALQGEAKWAALEAADLFVMPSDFENFGTAIVEAMRLGKAVITTTGTPWKVLAEQKAGWCVEPTIETLTKALCEAMSLPDDERVGMGLRARCIGDRYAPETVIGELASLYESLV